MGNFIKNIAYTLSSNLITLIVSTLTVLIVPKFIGVYEYSFWQLYVFYTSYVVVLHFGWLDGIYLRYGGQQYKKLNKGLFYSQFIQFLSFQVVFFGVIYVIAAFFFKGNNLYIWFCTGLAMVLINLRQFCLYILQDTGRLKEYSVIFSLDRILYLVGIFLLLIFKVNNFKYYIVVDLVGRAVSMFYAFFTCKELIFRKFSEFYFSLDEVGLNISIGVKLLIANFASSLIIGIVRYGIQYGWGVRVFGKMSLTLNVSNFLMTFISAVGLVLFPFLKRINKNQLQSFYNFLKSAVIIVMLIGIIVYYPLNYFLPMWLPKYKDALIYMGLLFPMAVYSGQFQLLISTFMKALRMEKQLLLVNLKTLLFSTILTIINVFLIKRIDITMFSIVLSLWFQVRMGQFYLNKKMKDLKTKSHYFYMEDLVVIIFVISNYLFPARLSFLVYSISIIIYGVINYKEIRKGYKNAKKLLM